MSIPSSKPEPDQKRRFPKFAWISAISLGGVLSSVMFLTGSQSFDDLLISTGLRTFADSSGAHVMVWGEVSAYVQAVEVINAPRDGIKQNFVTLKHLKDGTTLRESGTTAIKHFNGVTVDTGTIYYVEEDRKIEEVAQQYYCVVKQLYNFGIPVYHYVTGVAYGLNGPEKLSTVVKTDPFVLAGAAFARSKGVQDPYSGVYYDMPKQETHDFGKTMNWNYCQDYAPQP